MLSTLEIARMIDLSCVRADHTEEQILEAAATVRRHNCVAVFALPSHTPLLVDALSDRDDIHIGGVVGFPDGGASTRNKAQEAAELVAMGCTELDMVINITWLKAGHAVKVCDDIRAVIDAGGGAAVKVIFECHYLTDDEIVRACEICMQAGAAYVKTGTGWAPTGATVENIALMKSTVGDRCGVKAAGGVRDLETLLAMHEVGATRFGIGLRTVTTILADAAKLT